MHSLRSCSIFALSSLKCQRQPHTMVHNHHTHHTSRLARPLLSSTDAIAAKSSWSFTGFCNGWSIPGWSAYASMHRPCPVCDHGLACRKDLSMAESTREGRTFETTLWG